LHSDLAAVVATRAALDLTAEAPVLVLCPGAEYGPAKRWPDAHFAAVARHYRAQGWQVWLLGSAKDAPVTASIAAQAPGTVDLAGRTDLGAACDLIAAADLVVSNDSGLMHVAAAFGRPLVAVYGSSDPGFTPPLSDRARVLTLGLSCSPCFERECPLGHLKCLKDLAPAQVLAAADALLA
jgi:heptosyltransferase-2